MAITMDTTNAITPEAAQSLIDKAGPLSQDEIVKVLRYLKRANDDLIGRMRQLKNEVSRAARH